MPAPGRNRLLLFGQRIRYLLKASFSSDIAAPLPASLPVDLGGPLTVTDASSVMSISSGKLRTSGGTPAAESGFIDSQVYSRSAGRAIKVVFGAMTTPGNHRFGWHTLLGSGTKEGFTVGTATTIEVRAGTEIVTGLTVPNIANKTAWIILRAGGGAFYIIDGTLVWVSRTDTTASGLRLILWLSQFFATTIEWNEAKVLDLAPLDSRFATDYVLATNRLTLPAAGATTTSTADAVIEWTFVYASASTIVMARWTDASNHWYVQAAGAGSLQLHEVNAGVDTTRGSVAGVFTGTNTYRVVVVQDSATIKVYVNNVLQITYASASFNQTITGVRVHQIGNPISELVCWPRTVTLPGGI